MPISVRLRCGSGVVLCVGVGTAMPMRVRLRLSSGIAGACGLLEPGGADGDGLGSERRVSGVTLTCPFGTLFGGSAASGIDPHSESMSSVGGGSDELGAAELSADVGGTEGAFPLS
jgi:hypothetical protein